jgi:hypothetical protein
MLPGWMLKLKNRIGNYILAPNINLQATEDGISLGYPHPVRRILPVVYGTNLVGRRCH